MSLENKVQAIVGIGDEEVTIIRLTAKGTAHVARILGIENGGDVIYLDRLVHSPTETHLGDWACSGAISTILMREH